MMQKEVKHMLVSGLLAVECLFSGASVFAETEAGLADMARLAAAEGMVLLKNDNRTLPLSADQTVSVFGRMQVDYFACGYGSGGDVKTPYTINILDGLRRHPAIRVNESLAAIYEDWCGRHLPDHGSWGNWPLNHPEMPLDDARVAAAKTKSDVAVVVIGRSAGEDRETKLEPGSYYLTDEEEAMLKRVDRHFEQVVVLLNSGNLIDMSWIDRYAHIDSVMYVWQGGMQGGVAVADVLSGEVSPSGRLPATIAKRYEDYPTGGTSGGENIFGGREFSNYVEDIFVGYRYFETFAPDAVLYPFGYGLGYTDFAIETSRMHESNGRVVVEVKVSNTGRTYAGKEVVQVYYGAPQGRLGKALKSLVAYAKTSTLGPGESETIQLSFKVDDMASYDDAGVTGHKSAYVLEAGAYPVYVGPSVRDALHVGVHQEKQLRVTQQLSEVAAVAPDGGFKRLKAAAGRDGKIVQNLEDVPTRTVSLAATIKKNLPPDIARTGERGIQLADVFRGRADMTSFVAQLPVEELEALCRGDYVMGSPLGAPGNAAVYGGVSPALRARGVVPVTAADGPSGIRLTAPASLLPIGTALACSWNDGMVEELYRMLGREMIRNKVDVLLAPGINIHRDPLCGRNFEYFSEDPLLTGQMGASVVRGLQSQGVSATPKHFGLNNQETRRNMHDSRCSERALREIYAKAFEIVVKTASPHNMMASYNKVNGVYSHYHYELFTSLLREEWGYDGAVMTDWWMKPGESPDNPAIYDNAYRIQAQVDVLMPGEGPKDKQNDRSLLASYETGYGIALGEMQRSAINTLNYVMKSPAFRKANGFKLWDDPPQNRRFSVKQPAVETPRLASLELDGEALAVFHPLILDYTVYMPAGTAWPGITARAAGQAQVQVEPPSDGTPVAVVAVSNGYEKNRYRIYFSDAAGLPPSVAHPVYAKALNIYVNGNEIPEFYPGVYDYEVSVPDVTPAVITADVPEGTTVAVAQDPDRRWAVVRVESPHQAMEYKISLTSDGSEGLPNGKTIDILPNGSTKVQAEDVIYKSPRIEIQPCEDKAGGRMVGRIARGNALLYRLHVAKSGDYTVSPRIASGAGTLTQLSYQLEIDGDIVASYLHGGTGGWQNWQSMEAKPMYLEAGTHKLRIVFNSAGVNLNYVMFKYVQ
jgi:beta-glucosidase-like glycosyl hydrolase